MNLKKMAPHAARIRWGAVELEITTDAGDGRGPQTHVLHAAGGEIVIPAEQPAKKRRETSFERHARSLPRTDRLR